MTASFKAKTFRLNKSHQYADQLWLKSVGTIATPTTTGQTDSVKAAYLPEGDLAIPTVFGVLSWNAPGLATSGECKIKVFDNSSQMVTAASFTPEKASFSGLVNSAQGLEIDGKWRISIDPVTSGLTFAQKNTATGLYETKHMVTSE